MNKQSDKNMTDGQKPQRQEKKREPDGQSRRTGVIFGGSLSLLLVLGLLLPLRPAYSVSEKRALKTLPGISVQGLWKGEYFTELSAWFSDTFPFREVLTSGESVLENFYGLKGEAIYGKQEGTGDLIPEAGAGVAPTLALGTEAEPESDSAVAGENPSEPEAAASEEGTGETGAETAAESTGADAGDAAGEAASGAEFETNADGSLVMPSKPAEPVDLQGEQAGSLYVAGNAAYEIYYFNQGGATKYASMINTVKSILPDVNVYDILVPNSFGIELEPAVQETLGSSNMQSALEYIYSMLDPSVKKVPVFDTLLAHKDEYIYFHTDHHWTQLGAYYAYRQFCQAKGIAPHELSEYQPAEYSGFYGTFYFSTNRAEALKANPDTIYAYIPLGTNALTYVTKEGVQAEGNIINDASKMDSGNRYNCFIHGDNPISFIINPNITDGSSCILIKESYGNAFAPFLTDHYQTVYVIDYRYYKDDLKKLIAEKNVSDVIFLNNAEAISEKNAGEMLGLFD